MAGKWLSNQETNQLHRYSKKQTDVAPVLSRAPNKAWVAGLSDPPGEDGRGATGVGAWGDGGGRGAGTSGTECVEGVVMRDSCEGREKSPCQQTYGEERVS